MAPPSRLPSFLCLDFPGKEIVMGKLYPYPGTGLAYRISKGA